MVYSSPRLSRIAGRQNLQQKTNNKIQHNKLGVANCCCCCCSRRPPALWPARCSLCCCECLSALGGNSMNRLRQKRISVVVIVLSGLCLFLDKLFNGRNNKLDIKIHQLPKTTVDFHVSEEWSRLLEVNITLFLLMQRCFPPSEITGNNFLSRSSNWSVISFRGLN